MWITWRASLLQLPGWGSPPRPSHSTPWTREGTHNTTAPFAVVEAILDRQACLSSSTCFFPSQLPGGSPMTSRAISASRDASKDGSGDLQALPPNPILPSFNISFFFFLICMVLVASLTLAPSDALKEKSAYLLEAAFPWQHHSHQASVAGPPSLGVGSSPPCCWGGRLWHSLLKIRRTTWFLRIASNFMLAALLPGLPSIHWSQAEDSHWFHWGEKNAFPFVRSHHLFLTKWL